MKTVVTRLSKLKLKTFKVSYSPTYTSYIPRIIASNPSHPLYITQRRRQQGQRKEGLWWHATNGTDISKKSTVRTWARRRLRQAFVEELKVKGYDETGKLVDATALERRDVINVIKTGRSVDLIGSLRMHGVAPLVPAKFETVKEEMRGVVDALVQSAVDQALGFAGEGERSGGLRQRPQNRRPLGSRPVAAPMASRKILSHTEETLRVTPLVASAQALLKGNDASEEPRKTGAAPAPLRMKPYAKSSGDAPRHQRPPTKPRKARNAT